MRSILALIFGLATIYLGLGLVGWLITEFGPATVSLTVASFTIDSTTLYRLIGGEWFATTFGNGVSPAPFWLVFFMVSTFIWVSLRSLGYRVVETKILKQVLKESVQGLFPLARGSSYEEVVENVKGQIDRVTEGNRQRKNRYATLAQKVDSVSGLMAPLKEPATGQLALREQVLQLQKDADACVTAASQHTAELEQSETIVGDVATKVGRLSTQKQRVLDLQGRAGELQTELGGIDPAELAMKLSTLRGNATSLRSTVDKILTNPIGDNQSLDTILNTIENLFGREINTRDFKNTIETMQKLEERVTGLLEASGSPEVFAARLSTFLENVESTRAIMKKLEKPFGDESLDTILRRWRNRVDELEQMKLPDQARAVQRLYDDLGKIIQMVLDSAEILQTLVADAKPATGPGLRPAAE